MDTYAKNSGLTLVELVIVLVIIAIITMVTYMRWPGTSANVGAQAFALATDIRYAQNLSQARAAKFQLVLNQPSANNYQIRDPSGNPIQLAMGSTTMTLGANISFGAFTNLPNNMILFDSAGAPYINSNPLTALSYPNVATITLSDGTTTKTISIQPETGRVTVQ